MIAHRIHQPAENLFARHARKRENGCPANLDVRIGRAAKEHVAHTRLSALAERLDRRDAHRRQIALQMTHQRFDCRSVPVFAQSLRRRGANPDVAVFE